MSSFPLQRLWCRSVKFKYSPIIIDQDLHKFHHTHPIHHQPQSDHLHYFGFDQIRHLTGDSLDKRQSNEILKNQTNSERGRRSSFSFIKSINQSNRLADCQDKIVVAYNQKHQYKKLLINYVQSQWSRIIEFYNEFAHMDEVRLAQDKVIEIEEKLRSAQDERRNLQQKLIDIRRDVHQIHSDLAAVSKSDARYLELVRREFEIMRNERDFEEKFHLEDARERDLFTHLTAATKNSREKERNYENTVKYWSIIGSISGAVLGIIGTVISYQYRSNHHDLVRTRIETLDERVNTMQSILSELNGLLKSPQKNQSGESWGGFIYRKSVGCYRYFVPKTN